MKTLGKSVLMSVLLTGLLVAFLNAEKLQSSKSDIRALDVAAGNVEIADPTSPDPQVHCYQVTGPDELDVRTRMDFEARTSGGWIPTDADDKGNYCLVESGDAVKKRLAEQSTP